MTMAAVGITVAAVGAATGLAGLGYQLSGAGMPDQPDLGRSSAELANVNAKLLPIQRALEAAAQQGKKVSVNVPEHFEDTQAVQVLTGNKVMGKFGMMPELAWVPYVPDEWAKGGKYNPEGTTVTPTIKHKKIHVPEGPREFDFTGYGAAETQSKLAQAMAKVQRDLSQKYDSQFIDEALKQERLADPQSFEARSLMNELIQDQIKRPLNAPVADELARQVSEELRAGGEGRLDPRMHEVLMGAGSDALRSRGGSDAPIDFERPLVTGTAGTQRQLAAIGKATGELAGGQTPEDIAYRREQQDLANLADFVAGKTPQSQFSSLSSAQRGPTPFAPGQPLPMMPNNSQGAQGAALNAWQTQMGAAENQTPNWMTGLTAALGIGGAAAKLGWKPLA